MGSLEERIKERIKGLEADLSAKPMRHYVYSDLPFAIFCYDPAHEWIMRKEIRRLTTRLKKDTLREIETISLADLMWQSVDECEGLDAISQLEAANGFQAAQKQINRYLSDKDWSPLSLVLQKRLEGLQAQHYLVFIVRAGALAPNVYRVSKLLDEMKGKTRVPCVLFMPATTEGQTNMKYMGIAENEARGSYHTKVYTE